MFKNLYFTRSRSRAPANVVVCVLTKVGKPNLGSGKHKGESRDFRKKTRFKRRTAGVKGLISCLLRHRNIYLVF